MPEVSGKEASGKRVGADPIRTCLGCGERRPRKELWCFARNEPGRVVKDFNRRLAGRHAYCCRNESCLRRFLKNRKRVLRAFRTGALEYDEELHYLFGSVE